MYFWRRGIKLGGVATDLLASITVGIVQSLTAKVNEEFICGFMVVAEYTPQIAMKL